MWQWPIIKPPPPPGLTSGDVQTEIQRDQRDERHRERTLRQMEAQSNEIASLRALQQSMQVEQEERRRVTLRQWQERLDRRFSLPAERPSLLRRFSRSIASSISSSWRRLSSGSGVEVPSTTTDDEAVAPGAAAATTTSSSVPAASPAVPAAAAAAAAEARTRSQSRSRSRSPPPPRRGRLRGDPPEPYSFGLRSVDLLMDHTKVDAFHAADMSGDFWADPTSFARFNQICGYGVNSQSDSGLTLRNYCKFCVKLWRHNANQVSFSAKQLFGFV